MNQASRFILVVFWAILALHCVLLYYYIPYMAITKLLLVPTLLFYLLLKENPENSAVPRRFFYAGLGFALVGDMLLIIVNTTFFLSGMIAFILMMLCYSIFFLRLQPVRRMGIKKILITLCCYGSAAVAAYHFLAAELGKYKWPVFIYMFIIACMAAIAVNLTTSLRYGMAAMQRFVPACLVFTLSNTLLALNRFYWHGGNKVYILVMITYGVAQYLFVTGMAKCYQKKTPDLI
ncbi:lysoplasmalogenase [Sediminibacterium ginsengisoli]|nr:lysoplasmalogenase [Sediminibacterium ginsengisoli]